MLLPHVYLDCIKVPFKWRRHEVFMCTFRTSRLEWSLLRQGLAFEQRSITESACHYGKCKLSGISLVGRFFGAKEEEVSRGRGTGDAFVDSGHDVERSRA